MVNSGVAYKDPIAEKIAYDIWRAEKLQGKWGGQCVKFIRDFTGYSEVKGDARHFKTNTTTPSIGSIGKMHGHLFYILDIQGNTLYIVDSNYGWTERVRVRYMKINDKNIVGYLTFREAGDK